MRFAALITVTAFVSFSATAADLQEGKDYTVIQSPAPQDPAKISVTEFFSYQCPHCFAFSKPLHEWSLKVPADVQFDRKAVSIGHQTWVDIARTFYALQTMGNLDALDADIFNAIHQQGVRMDSVSLIMGWLSKRNVDLLKFDAAYRSQPARSAYEKGEQLAIEYRVPSIPLMVIDGKYMVTIASNVPFEPQLAMVDQLIAKAREERKKAKP